ncbi:hypothetical protein JTB14_000302 [Gonioctena quinquepunctata]|nr:hypothetical protein JTB14_000302 [Gonioctena quinquepunctata]
MSDDTKKWKLSTVQRGTEILKMTELKKFAYKVLTDDIDHHNFKSRYKFIDLIKVTFDYLHNNIVGIVSNQDNGNIPEPQITFIVKVFSRSDLRKIKITLSHSKV